MNNGYDVLSIDHCYELGSDFQQAWSMTIALQNPSRIVYFRIVESTSFNHVLAALKVLAPRLRMRKSRLIICIDNVPHSGSSPMTDECCAAIGAEAVVQDLMHVVKTAQNGTDNTNEFNTSGKVFFKTWFW